MCVGGCGGPSAEAIGEMNKKGIYMPKQILEQVQGDWNTVNKAGSKTVTPADLKKIVMGSVAGLGKLGGNDKFNPKAFADVQKTKFPDNTEFTKAETV